MFWHYGFGWGFPFFFLFPLGWLIFWIVIVMLFWRGGRRHWHRHGYGPGGMSAEEILRERFAHGDINEKEYRERMAVLGGTHRAASDGQ